MVFILFVLVKNNKIIVNLKEETIMTKEETLNVVTEIIDESAKHMKEKAKEMLNNPNIVDVNVFGDRNTFARIMFEILTQFELPQYEYKGNRKDKTFKHVYHNLLNTYVY